MNLSRRAAVCLMAVAIAEKGNAQAGRYLQVNRTPDGIGKSYMGREIAGVMGWQGAAWLEREDREQEERGDLLLRELAIKPGGRVAYVEYRAEDQRVPIKALHKMSQAQVRKEAAAHALVYERTAATLPWQHVVIFRKD